jgi:putative ABC transport system permease protein
VIAYTVSQQRHEIGIRMALGARAIDVLGLVVRMTLRLVLVGVVLGVAGSFAVMRVLSSQIWGVSPRDPITLGSVVLAMAVASTAACYFPARRAMKVDPMIALRVE